MEVTAKEQPRHMDDERPWVVYLGDELLRSKRGIVRRFESGYAARCAGSLERDLRADYATLPTQEK